MISKELLDILACPVCKTPVRLEEERIVCTNCGRRYPVREGIPVMLVEEADSPEGKQPKKSACGRLDCRQPGEMAKPESSAGAD